MRTEILGVAFDVVTPAQARDKVIGFLDGDIPRSVFTPNPEFVMCARSDGEFRRVLNEGDIVVPDGVGIVIASKINGGEIKERVTGYDLVQGIFSCIKTTGKTVYFFGGAPGVAELAREKMTEAYPGLKIVGVSDGYFDEDKEKRVISDIKRIKPDILLVGLGFPKQEKWIAAHKDELPCKLLIGIGGAFDGMSGRIKRAPKIFRRLGLEWFYRLMRQPSRIRRQMVLPKFLITVVFEKVFNGVSVSKNKGKPE